MGMDTAADLLPRFFGWPDIAALFFFLLCWAGMTVLVEHPPKKTPSVHVIMAEHRLRWMMAMLEREPRIMDATLLNSLRAACAFFASGSMIAIGGVVALLGQADQLVGVAHDISLDTGVNREGWEAKLLILALVLVSAFMKFVWSHRLFGYCAVLMGAVGAGGSSVPANRSLARKAATINVNAGRNFNRGMRTTYFAMALLPWLLGPLPLVAATAITSLTLYRREFRSASRRALLSDDAS